MCPICRAYGSARRLTVKPGPGSHCASLTSSGSTSTAPCNDPPWTTGGGAAFPWRTFGTVPCRHRGAPEARGRTPLTHDLAQVQAVHPTLQPGDVLVADRGLCSYAHVALLVQAGVHAVLRVGARQIVDFTPGRPFVKPSVQRTPAVNGIPRSCWLKALGVQDQLVAWLKPKTCPSWLTRETLLALPDSIVLREVRYGIGRPGFRTRQITLVTTRLDAAVYRVDDLAELSRLRW
jgi:hypothetical protein